MPTSIIDRATSRKLDALSHYLKPALDDLRGMNMEFEAYLLEMVVLSLREREEGGRVSRSLHEHVPA